MKKPKLIQIDPAMLRADLLNLSTEAKRVIRCIRDTEKQIDELRADLESCGPISKAANRIWKIPEQT